MDTYTYFEYKLLYFTHSGCKENTEYQNILLHTYQ